MEQGYEYARRGRIHYYAEGAGKPLVLADCGHFPMIDDPARFVREVTRLIHQVTR